MDIAVKPKVSVIIVNYNSSSMVNDCLESLFRFTEDISVEIIIVDNATESLSEVISYAGKSNVKLLQLDENIGFGMANNAGADMARGDYIFCLNPDTLLLNNAIKILSDFLDANPRCAACGGNLYDMSGMPSFSFRRIEPGISYEINDLLHNIPIRIAYGKNQVFNHSGQPMKVFYISGADLMIRKEVFKNLGGFSSDFFMYYEETDLCKRIYEMKMSVWSVPAAKIIHFESASFDNRISDRRVRMIEQGRIIYYRRNLSPLHRGMADFIYKIFLMSRARFVSNPFKKEYYQRRLDYFRKLT